MALWASTACRLVERTESQNHRIPESQTRAERRQKTGDRRQEVEKRNQGSSDPHTIPYLTLPLPEYRMPYIPSMPLHTNPYPARPASRLPFTTTATLLHCYSYSATTRESTVVPLTIRPLPFALHPSTTPKPFLLAFPPCLEPCVNAHASVPMFCAPSLNGAKEPMHACIPADAKWNSLGVLPWGLRTSWPLI